MGEIGESGGIEMKISSNYLRTAIEIEDGRDLELLRFMFTQPLPSMQFPEGFVERFTRSKERILAFITHDIPANRALRVLEMDRVTYTHAVYHFMKIFG